MEFYTSSKFKRPIRLSEKTRQFAYDSIYHHKYGLEALETPYVSLDSIEYYDSMTELEKHNTALYEIASKAPIRICDGELISGAATLGTAITHNIPAKRDGENFVPSVSHLTVDFFTVLETGLDGIRKKAETSLENHTDKRKIEFVKSCIHCIDCIKHWHDRYIATLSAMPGYEANLANLKNVPFKPASSFYEAVQSIWFCFAYLRLNGNWPGIGRLDVLLGKYLKADLESGKITLDKAIEILAHFFIKGCEWITGNPCGSGDAQHYQNIVLSGIDENGNDVTNEVTYLILEILEETGISDFPTTVRINKNTDERLLHKVSEVIRFGGGVVAVYNEDLILESLSMMGYSANEAVKFANDGCWEVQIPGKTMFSYVPFDGLAILQRITLDNYSEDIDFQDFDSIVDKYKKDLNEQVTNIFVSRVTGRYADENFNFKPSTPCTPVSVFENSCIEKGLSYYEGGTDYTVISPHIGGLPDIVNSLYAIKKAVFDEKLVTFRDFMTMLRNNWENGGLLLKTVRNKYIYFGNDNDECDEIATDILGAFADMCMSFDKKTPTRFVSGVSTFGRQIEWAPSRYAAPFGRKAGEVLSGNMSPTPGTDKNGATAIIKSYCKADLRKQHTGAALDIGFIPSNLDSENAINAISGLIKGFVNLGGFFMQIDTVDRSVLIDAQKHPENYKELSVRVSGWNARFVTMNKQWQDMIIERTK